MANAIFIGGGRERLLPNLKLRLREQFREVARFKHLSLRTEGAYWDWVVRFLKFHRSQKSGVGSQNSGKDTSPRPSAHSSDERGEGEKSAGGGVCPAAEKNFSAEAQRRGEKEILDEASKTAREARALPKTNGWRHPREMGAGEGKEFLVYLAVERTWQWRRRIRRFTP